MKLPVEFKGIWYSAAYGGYNPKLLDRFKLEKPIIEGFDISRPEWMTKDEFETNWGNVTYIEFSPDKDFEDEGQVIIWTTTHVVTLQEYAGFEYFFGLPRNPPIT